MRCKKSLCKGVKRKNNKPFLPFFVLNKRYIVSAHSCINPIIVCACTFISLKSIFLGHINVRFLLVIIKLKKSNKNHTLICSRNLKAIKIQLDAAGYKKLCGGIRGILYVSKIKSTRFCIIYIVSRT